MWCRVSCFWPLLLPFRAGRHEGKKRQGTGRPRGRADRQTPLDCSIARPAGRPGKLKHFIHPNTHAGSAPELGNTLGLVAARCGGEEIGGIRQGKSGGGLCYGYEVVLDQAPDGAQIRGGRRIIEAEAKVVRRIFHAFAAYLGYCR